MNKDPLSGAVTHCGGEEAARLEMLQCHGAGVRPKEQDKGHQGDVRHEAAGLTGQLTAVLQAILLGQGRPGGVHRLWRCKLTSKRSCFKFPESKYRKKKKGKKKTRTLRTRTVWFVQAVSLEISDVLPVKEKKRQRITEMRATRRITLHHHLHPPATRQSCPVV